MSEDAPFLIPPQPDEIIGQPIPGERSRMELTSIVNAPSHAVRLGGPEGPLTEEEIKAADEVKYGGQIKIGMVPDSPHPVGSRGNPVDVDASRQANQAANEIASRAADISEHRLGSP